MDFYLVRVKCRENLAFLKFSKEELDAETFRQKGKQHRENVNEIFRVDLKVFFY